jgi:Tfp pilus assembly protein PilO
LLACAALAVTLVGSALSLRHQRGRLRQEAADLGEQVRQSELLVGFLDQLRRHSDSLGSSDLPLPEHRALPPDRLPDLEELIRSPAAAAGVELLEVRVDVTAVSGDYQRLPVDVAVVGAHAALRAYLLEVCRIPCLLRLESVSLNRVDEGRLQMALGLVLDIASAREGS